MQRIAYPRAGLTFDEAVELKGQPSFPMTMEAASDYLRSRGYDCVPLMLETLSKNKTMKPANLDSWSQANLEAAAEFFENANIFMQYALMCHVVGGRYVDFLRALRDAADRESAKYGQRVIACDQYFVMHLMPPREVDGPDGKSILQLAVFSFTLCDDIRERLERGDPV